MSESMLFVAAADFDKLAQAYTDIVNKKALPAGVSTDLPFKGYVICPSIDSSGQPAVYINPVFGKDPLGEGDVIVQTNSTKACPYPPGYPAGQPPTPNFAK